MPIITFVAAGAGHIIRLFGPEYMGGAGDIGAKIDAEVARTGLSADEIGPKVLVSYNASTDELSDLISPKIYYHTEGKLVRIPGLPEMYDYEFFPQKVGLFELTERVLIGFMNF